MILVPAYAPILRKICRRDFTIGRTQIDEMFQLLESQQALGLAAPQVGIDARLFITHWGSVFIDPSITRAEELYYNVEGCLSLPGYLCEVRRWRRIWLADGSNYDGEAAAVIQHELDHLDGKLIG